MQEYGIRDETMNQEKEYFAFISYQRKDEEWADRLRSKLEHYRLPSSVRKQDASLPKEIRPIFRDALELSGGVLAKEIETALQQSKFLIVICSPNSAKSPWVNKEIQTFIDLGRDEKIIPFIIDGTPFSGNEDTECFPPALRSLKGEKELLGININELSRDAATIKVVARMFGLKFDTLWQRYEREKKRKRWMMTGGTLLFALVSLGIGWHIYQSNIQLEIANNNLEKANNKIRFERDRAETANTALQQANDSIQRQYVLIGQQKNDLAIANNFLDQKNRDLKIANANIYKAMQESEAKRLAARALTLLENGDSYEARKVAIHALPPYFPYTPEAEHALINAEAQNTAVIHGYSGYGIFYSTNCAEFSPNGKYIATGASHEQVKIWDANNGQELLSLTSDTLIAGYGDSMTKRKCHSISFSKDGNFLLAGLSDGTARLWNMKTFIECGRFDSKRGDKVYINNTWNFNDGANVLNSHTGAPKERKDACDTHASFSNDGKLVATASYDGIVKIWNIKTGKLIKEIDNIIHAMEDVSFSPNDKQLLLFLRTEIGGANPITIYDLEKNDTTFTVYGNCATFGKDGQTLAVGGYTNGDISVYNLKAHEILYTLKGHKSQINTISFDQTGNYIVSSSNDNTVRLWHIDSSKIELNKKSKKHESGWELIKTYEGHQKKVNSASFSYDGRRIVSTSDDNTIRLWDVPLNSKTSRRISHSSRFAIYNSDGKCYLGTKGVKIKGHFLDVDIPVLYDSKTHKHIREFKGHSNDVLFATFSPNNRNIVTTSRDSTLKIWSIDDDSVIQTLKGHQSSVAHANYSKDGKYIVSAGYDKSIKIWDANSGKELYTGIGHKEVVHSVSFNQNGQYIVSASIDGSVRIWSNQAKCQKILIHNPYISADFACYSPCGKYIAAGFNDGTIRIWESSNYNELYVIKAHDQWIRYLSFSRDGKKLVSASQDNTVKIWDTATGHELRTISCEGIVETACLSPDMKECLIAVSGHDIKCVEIPAIEEVINIVSKRFAK